MATRGQGARQDPLLSRAIGPGLAVVTAVVGAAGLFVGSFHLLEWGAAGLVALAFIGRRTRWAGNVAAGYAAFGGAWVGVNGARVDANGLPLLAGGLAVTALSLLQLGGFVPRRRRIDPVVLVAVQLGVGLVARWSYNLIMGSGLDPTRYGVDTWATPFVEELPLLAIGLAGAGLAVFRDPRQAISRLGLARPTWWQAAAAVAVVILLSFLDRGADLLTYLLMPRSYDAINAILDKANGGLPVGLLGAVMAGICEETLFRGALQPRAGLAIAAMLFASGHLYYGATPILVFVIASGLAYGWLRQRMNLTTAILAHTGYDITTSISADIARLGLLVLGVCFVAAAVRSDGHGWSRYVVPLAAAASFIVIGASVVTFTGSAVAWKAFGTAAFLSMAAAVLLEGSRARMPGLTVAGLLAWLVAIAVFLSAPWHGVAGWFAFPAWLIAASVGMIAWHRLGSSGYADPREVTE